MSGVAPWTTARATGYGLCGYALALSPAGFLDGLTNSRPHTRRIHPLHACVNRPARPRPVPQICRVNAIGRWPFRKRSSLDRLIEKVGHTTAAALLLPCCCCCLAAAAAWCN